MFWRPLNAISQVSEWVIKFNSLFRTADSKVHVIILSHIINTYAMELLFSLT